MARRRWKKGKIPSELTVWLDMVDLAGEKKKKKGRGKGKEKKSVGIASK